jgi:hypothetical protein
MFSVVQFVFAIQLHKQHVSNLSIKDQQLWLSGQSVALNKLASSDPTGVILPLWGERPSSFQIFISQTRSSQPPWWHTS